LALKAILARVYGRVQRVGYRRFVLDSAQELGLSGYVRNEKGDSVTIFVQGDDAVVEKFIEMIKSPPHPAHVRSIDVKDARPRPALKYFATKPSPLNEELQEGSAPCSQYSWTTGRSSGTSGKNSETIGRSFKVLWKGSEI